MINTCPKLSSCSVWIEFVALTSLSFTFKINTKNRTYDTLMQSSVYLFRQKTVSQSFTPALDKWMFYSTKTQTCGLCSLTFGFCCRLKSIWSHQLIDRYTLEFNEKWLLRAAGIWSSSTLFCFAFVLSLSFYFPILLTFPTYSSAFPFLLFFFYRFMFSSILVAHTHTRSVIIILKKQLNYLKINEQ